MRTLLSFIIIFSFHCVFAQNTVIHEITKGETLYKLSKIYNVPVESLKSLNKLESNEVIPGQEIKINYAISKEEVQRNTNLYFKEAKEKELQLFSEKLESRIDSIELEEAKLDISTDVLELMKLSRLKKSVLGALNEKNTETTKQIEVLDDKIKNFEIIDSEVVVEISTSNNINESLKEEKQEAKGLTTKEDTLLVKKTDKTSEVKKEIIDPVAAKIAENSRLRKEKAAKIIEDERLALEAEEQAKLDKIKAKEDKIANAKIAKENAKKLKEQERIKIEAEKQEKLSNTKEKDLKSVKTEIVKEKKTKINKDEKKKTESELKEAKVLKKAELRSNKILKLQEEEKEALEKLKALKEEADNTKTPKVKTKEKDNKTTKKVKTSESIVVKKKSQPIQIKDVSNDEIIKAKLDSLNKLKQQNQLFLDSKLAEIDAKKSLLNEEDNLPEILKLSKEKFFVTDSIKKQNKIIDKALRENNKLIEKNNEIIVDSKPIKDKDVFITDGNQDEIQISAKEKRKLEKLASKERNEDIIAKESKKNKSKDIAISKNVKEVTVSKSKKKIKYSFGDEVDQVLKEKAMFFLSRAKIEIDKQNISKAKEYIDKSLSLNPSYEDAYILKADIYSSMEYFDRALNLYSKASILNPKNAQLRYNMGNCLIRMDNEKKAIYEWSKAIEIDSNYILAYAGRASLFLKEGEYKKAIDDYNRIFEINKFFYVAYKGRGVAYLENGDFGKAIIDFNNFLEYEPEDNFIFWKRGLAKLYDNNIYGGCLDLLTSSEAGNNDAEKALRKHCEK